MRKNLLLSVSLTCLCLLAIPMFLVTGSDARVTVASTTVSVSAEHVDVPAPFPVHDYTFKTITVQTDMGAKQITCRYYKNITYVADPMDADYQHLDILVPLVIDGTHVDATEAPILLNIGVTGYLAATDIVAGMHTLPRLGIYTDVDLALAAGYVVVSPACRGRDNVTADGVYYGKAPAAIVDLKCAIKYIRYYDDLVPGDATKIVTCGQSAGGALSALLGVSGDSTLFDPYFEQLGAAPASDAVLASASYCPVTDLDHADMAYEWQYGLTPTNSGEPVDQELSRELALEFSAYQESLGLEGRDGFGLITAQNYDDYLLEYYLLPAAQTYLDSLTDDERDIYLTWHEWVQWTNGTVTFDWGDYSSRTARIERAPGFDALDMGTRECSLFGDEHSDIRHYTDYSLRRASGDKTATIGSALGAIVDLMNPMFFIEQALDLSRDDPRWTIALRPLEDEAVAVADQWWIRHGTRDSYTSLPSVINLAAGLENLGMNVNVLLYWDAGHGANLDADDFIVWLNEVTGHKAP